MKNKEQSKADLPKGTTWGNFTWESRDKVKNSGDWELNLFTDAPNGQHDVQVSVNGKVAYRNGVRVKNNKFDLKETLDTVDALLREDLGYDGLVSVRNLHWNGNYFEMGSYAAGIATDV